MVTETNNDFRLCEKCGAKNSQHYNYCWKDGWRLGVPFNPVRDEIPMWSQIQQAISRSQTELQADIVNLKIELATIKQILASVTGDVVCKSCNRVYRLGQVPNFCSTCGNKIEQGGQ